MTATAEQKKATCSQRIDEVESQIESVPVTRCRICFKETENSVQCQLNRSSCSGWSNETSPAWTEPFRDDTDDRPHGCIYQWYIECQWAVCITVQLPPKMTNYTPPGS